MEKLLTESEKVEQQNRLIAEFMGAQVINDTDYNFVLYGFPDKQPGSCFLKQMKYHSSWDWLMEVWYKFRDLTFKDRKNEIPHSHHCQSISRAICFENISKAYSRLSNAIEWYNEYLTASTKPQQ